MVIWTYNRRRHFVDVETEAQAYAMGIILAETGRENVVIQESKVDIDPETMAAVQERVRAKLAAVSR